MIRTRLASYYGATFLMIGVHLPFWPIWLQSRGLDAEQIGIVMASGIVIKILANPFVAHLADRYGERKRLIILLGALSLLTFSLFVLSQSFWTIIVVNCLFFAFWSPAMPLQESLTTQSGARLGFDYGRVRLWGSVTFIVSAVGIGHFLKTGSSELVYTTIMFTLALTLLCAFLLPDHRSPILSRQRLPLVDALKDRQFVVFLVGAALIQASHAVYYGFGTIHWKRAGIGSDVIGGLWAEGVIVEIILFIFGPQVLGKIGPTRLIALAGMAGAVRWAGIGITTALPALIILQALHGLTFGAAHLGAMHFIQNRVAPELSATAQSLYSSMVMGIGMGIAMLISGRLYGAYAGQAYYLMAAMAAVGGVVVFVLRRQRV